MIAEHKISNREYENDWLDNGCAVFKKQSLQETEWIPDQIFQGDRVFRFMLPYEYFRESVYDVVTKALRERGEDEFVIVPAGSSQSKISYVLRYATTDSYQEYLLHIDEPGFFSGRAAARVLHARPISRLGHCRLGIVQHCYSGGSR